MDVTMRQEVPDYRWRDLMPPRPPEGDHWEWTETVTRKVDFRHVGDVVPRPACCYPAVDELTAGPVAARRPRDHAWHVTRQDVAQGRDVVWVRTQFTCSACGTRLYEKRPLLPADHLPTAPETVLDMHGDRWFAEGQHGPTREGT
jgi:hypothetical protein